MREEGEDVTWWLVLLLFYGVLYLLGGTIAIGRAWKLCRCDACAGWYGVVERRTMLPAGAREHYSKCLRCGHTWSVVEEVC